MIAPSNDRQPIVIDRLTAQAAQNMLKPQTVDKGVISSTEVKYDQLERFATNGLGVLQEQGVYALILYFLANSGETKRNSAEPLSDEKFAVCTILLHLIKLIPELGLKLENFSLEEVGTNPVALNGQKQKILEYFASHISGNLNHLLTLKMLLLRP